MKYLAQTTPKPNNEEGRKNQDAIQIELNQVENVSYFALADGAGGYGAFNSEWAQLLVDNCPAKPIQSTNEIDNWITAIYQDFYKNAEESLKTKEYLVNKFYKEGSASTLVACWFDNSNIDSHTLNLTSYGDSFYLLKINNDFYLPTQRNSIELFEQNPYLVNWNIENSKEEGFSSLSIEIKKGDKFELFVCSDALGQFILSYYQKEFETEKVQSLLDTNLSHNQTLRNIFNNDIGLNTILDNLKKSLTSKILFQEYTNEQFKNELLESDDYSLVYFAD